ncbi:tRNA lysidine(34) synthetase TilS [Enterococcus sp. LJL128]
MMLDGFYQEGLKQGFWHSGERILLAVSGGVDSMVLLHLMLAAAEKSGCVIGVAHVNHQLRPESFDEEEWLNRFCEEKKIPFYSKRWGIKTHVQGMEAEARAFRYNFFEEVMESDKYSTLMTAHHGDDLAETIIMKLTRGSSLLNMSGIKSSRSFGKGRLVRPLLIFSKDELKLIAKEQRIVYFEDSTNFSDWYFRNRIRHQVIPKLKEENAGFLKHTADFSCQVQYAAELIEEVVKVVYAQGVQEIQDGWRFDLKMLENKSRVFKYFFFQNLLQQTLIPEKVEIKHEQLERLVDLVSGQAPQKQLSFENDWLFIKEYSQGYLRKRTQVKAAEEVYFLEKGQGIFLSETEWLGFETPDELLEFPKKVKEWQTKELAVSSQLTGPLTIRRRKNGDRIALTEKLTKRVNRLFIDRKVPDSLREKAWLIFNNHQELIWVPGFANSYLSIPQETDKIHYRLLYITKE